MGLKTSGLNELRERLERLRPEEVMARALAEQANRMAARVRDGLSEPPGAGGHDEPWLQSGALRNSVGAQADGLQAVVGSSDPAADGNYIGLRPKSKSGPPTIDVNVAGTGVRELKFRVGNAQ